jgi:flagellar basal body-associated protein FliL
MQVRECGDVNNSMLFNIFTAMLIIIFIFILLIVALPIAIFWLLSKSTCVDIEDDNRQIAERMIEESSYAYFGNDVLNPGQI